jgi:predicted esterase
MERPRGRRFGVKGWLCAWGMSVALCSAAPVDARAEAAPQPITLPQTAEQAGVVIYPARVMGPHPITVLLHGMCGDPARSCSHFADEVTRTSTLICPRASLRCPGGGSSWPESGVAEAVERAVARAKLALPEAIDDTQRRTLIGYSLGAYRAQQIALTSGGKYARAMFIGARVSLDARLLAQNGVMRVLLCAGEWDMTHDPMQHEARRLQRAGFPSRFLGLGPVGHLFTPSFASYLPEAWSWLTGS